MQRYILWDWKSIKHLVLIQKISFVPPSKMHHIISKATNSSAALGEIQSAVWKDDKDQFYCSSKLKKLIDSSIARV